MSDKVGAIYELPHGQVSEKETIAIVPNTPPHIPVSSLLEKNYDFILSTGQKIKAEEKVMRFQV